MDSERDISYLDEPDKLTPEEEALWNKLRRNTVRHHARQDQEKRVYFIEADGVAVKIGFTHDVVRRIRVMQIDCPHRLYVIGAMKAGYQIESKLHKKFRRYRIRGEWFNLAPEILEYIRENSINVAKSYRLRQFTREAK